jgi:hypothetical protein
MSSRYWKDVTNKLHFMKYVFGGIEPVKYKQHKLSNRVNILAGNSIKWAKYIPKLYNIILSPPDIDDIFATNDYSFVEPDKLNNFKCDKYNEITNEYGVYNTTRTYHYHNKFVSLLQPWLEFIVCDEIRYAFIIFTNRTYKNKYILNKEMRCRDIIGKIKQLHIIKTYHIKRRNFDDQLVFMCIGNAHVPNDIKFFKTFDYDDDGDAITTWTQYSGINPIYDAINWLCNYSGIHGDIRILDAYCGKGTTIAISKTFDKISNIVGIDMNLSCYCSSKYISYVDGVLLIDLYKYLKCVYKTANNIKYIVDNKHYIISISSYELMHNSDMYKKITNKIEK